MFPQYSQEDAANLTTAIKHHPILGLILSVVIMVLNFFIKDVQNTHIPPFVVEGFQVLMYIGAFGTFCIALLGYIERRIEKKKQKEVLNIDENKVD